MQKKILLLTFITLGMFAIKAQTNLLKNSDFETQGAWLINQCDPKGSFDVTFGSTVTGLKGGSGKNLELTLAPTNPTAEVFIYQAIAIKPGHTYKFTAAIMDMSTNLTNAWIEIAWVTDKPKTGAGITENKPGLFGSWQACNGVYFNGLIDTSCSVYATGTKKPYPYFHVSDTLKSDTIYFGVDLGTYGVADIDMYFDNVTLIDSAGDVLSVNKINSANSELNNYPNPFNLKTTINYSVPVNGSVELNVYNLFGAKVACLVNETKPSGNYKITFDGAGYSGGIYFYDLKVNGVRTSSNKMMLLK